MDRKELELFIELKYFPVQATKEYVDALPIPVLIEFMQDSYFKSMPYRDGALRRFELELKQSSPAYTSGMLRKALRNYYLNHPDQL